MPDLGKHFVVGLQGVKLSDIERTLWKELRPLGVILFRRNITQSQNWRQDLRALIEELKELSGRKEFIASIDHEGGRVHRLSPPITQFPAAKNWGENSFSVGASMGRELSSLGINLNYAPSFDILTEPKNTVIGDRAFDSNPKDVSNRALAFLDGLESEGVLGCAKHFPGHGRTVEDSHLELPILEVSKDILEKEEIVPFKSYIDSGRELVMTAHVIYKALDDKNPATLSRPILTSLLREQLGFKGAIITDALDMGALSGIREDEVAKKFITAGGDLFCVCQDTNDRNSTGEKISPIQAASIYAQALRKEKSISADLKRSETSIDRLLAKLSAVTKPENKELSKSDLEKSAQLLAELKLGTA